MKQLKLILILLGVLSAPGFVSAQEKNRISLQTGLFHCFFDGSPMMNVNYPNDAKKPFNGLLINSLGIEYRRALNEKSAFSIGYDSFREEYDKHYRTYPTYEPIVGRRLWKTIKVNYYRSLPLNDRFNFVYGADVNFRTGAEKVIIATSMSGNINGEATYESLIESVGRNDFGLNIFTGFDYTPVNWLTLSASIDFLGSVYIHYKKDAKEMKEVYDSPQFPSRYDLSFNLGVGFNF